MVGDSAIADKSSFPLFRCLIAQYITAMYKSSPPIRPRMYLTLKLKPSNWAIQRKATLPMYAILSTNSALESDITMT